MKPTSNKPQTQNEYETRINTVIDHIDAHLDKKLSLNKLAKVACFSPFHFHRVFSAMVGETLNDFIRRLRLERAANVLVHQSSTTITGVALQCGFVSSAVFARVFKEYYGCSATHFRNGKYQNGKICKANSKIRKARDDQSVYHYVIPKAKWLKKHAAKKVEVKKLRAMQVAYIRHFGEYGPTIFNVWDRLFCWGRAHDLITPKTQALGVVYDNPGITPATKCRYDACITLAADSPLPPGRGIGRKELSGGLFAVYPFEGRNVELKDVYHYLYGHWLMAHGYEPDDLPGYQMFGLDRDPGRPEKMTLEIYIPVRPL